MDRNYRDMVKVGERIMNVERLFNIREGYTRKDDRLPKRFLEPLPDGQSKGQTIDVNRMLDFYYRLRGWDMNGIPTKEKLEELELS
jgi:aldehyde:ferredoxin oxidoreductase